MARHSFRVNVVVTPEQHRLLMELARLQNRSAASLVREMIDAAEPFMQKTAGLLKLAEDASQMSRKGAVEAIRDILEELRQLAGDGDQMDLLSLLSGRTGEGDEPAAPATSVTSEDAAGAPPSSNTGVSLADPKGGEAVSDV